jgi:glycosyltransferase involved in cell wall biosynthesis
MKSLLIIGFVWPEPTSTAAGSRMLQLIELFQKNNYTITFVCSASKTKNSFNLEQLNIKIFKIQLNNPSFDSFIKQLNPAIVLFDRFLTEEQFGWRIAESCPNSIRILDTEDLHFLRSARQTAHKKNTELSLDVLTNDVTKRELASIYRCDLALIISKFEMKLLKKTFKIDKSLLQYVPFLLNNIKLKSLSSYPTFQERKNFIAIGNFKHEPNLNAVLYLKNKIWPLIKQQLPEAKMLVYGAYVTNKVLQLHNEKEGFLIKGWAANASEVFKNAKVCLAPIQFGAGLKGKLIESMQYGTPSVTTSIGAEAMHGKLPWNGFIVDDPVKFSLKAIELYTNKKTWLNAQQNGLKIINKCFSKEKHSNNLLKKINFIEDHRHEHRLHNFIGALLMHHTLKSTKYLAKWIEEKNK